MSALRLLLDEDVPILLATTLRARGLDAIHATETGLRGREDADVFAAAILDERAVLTHNVGDFVALVAQFGTEGRRHYGLVLSEQLEFRELLGRVLHLLADRDAESMLNAVAWLMR